jgi:hypothetical protein
MALPPSGLISAAGCDSTLAKNCFKPKMICETALPGVLDIDLKSFIDGSEGR